MNKPNVHMITMRCLLILVFLLVFSFQSTAFLFKYSEKIDSFLIVYDTTALRLPGESFGIDIVAYMENGKVKSTAEPKFFNSLWRRFNVEVNGGNFCNGKVTVSEKLMPSKGKYISIAVYQKKILQNRKRLLLALHFDESIEIIPIAELIKTPGYGFHFKVVSTFNNGAKREMNYSRHRELGESYHFAVNGGDLNRGKFVINSDFRYIDDHLVTLAAYSLRNTDCVAEFTFQLDYRAAQNFWLSGWDGSNGRSGSDGANGSAGCNGGHGENGYDGQHGDHGPDIGVWADLYHDSILGIPLVYLYAKSFQSGREYRYLVNPDGGTFKVSSHGGNGGRGGSGGNGGHGGRGADGAWHCKTVAINDSVTKEIRWQDPGQDGGDGGYGGVGGHGGVGGYGGNIFIYLSDDAVHYHDIIQAYSSGGSGGSGGFWGSAGSGGSGGSGNPTGNSGSGGSGGSGGQSGFPGSGGEVFYGSTNDFVEFQPVAFKVKR